MYTLTVSKTIKAASEEVFEAFTDHEALSQVALVRSCTLERRGDTEKNGLGAVRVLDCCLITLREEIIGFDRPYRMEYRIRNSRPPSDHEFAPWHKYVPARVEAVGVTG